MDEGERVPSLLIKGIAMDEGADVDGSSGSCGEGIDGCGASTWRNEVSTSPRGGERTPKRACLLVVSEGWLAGPLRRKVRMHACMQACPDRQLGQGNVMQQLALFQSFNDDDGPTLHRDGDPSSEGPEREWLGKTRHVSRRCRSIRSKTTVATVAPFIQAS